MPEPVDLASRIEKQLPRELIAFTDRAGKEAAGTHQKLYLVGGVVRDLLLNRPTSDLDLVVEGDAISLARRMAAVYRAKLTVHHAFNTAKLRWGQWSIDLATARSETYSKPGALPQVKAGTIQTDLLRRDFTINAMAVDLTSGHWGELIDLHGGLGDLQRELVRVLHEGSFIDDATRMWRAVRYEQRLGFRLERSTKRLLVRDLAVLDAVSGDRIRHELEMVLREESPENDLRRADELGILARVHPSLKADAWLARKFRQVRNTADEASVSLLYLCVLVVRLETGEVEQFSDYLKVPKRTALALRDTVTLKSRLGELSKPALKPSEVYYMLEDLTPAAVACCQLAVDSPLVRRRLAMYLSKLRRTKTSLTGDDLIEMGIQQGPRIKEVLARLKDARLDGRVSTREGEVEMAKRLI